MCNGSFYWGYKHETMPHLGLPLHMTGAAVSPRKNKMIAANESWNEKRLGCLVDALRAFNGRLAWRRIEASKLKNACALDQPRAFEQTDTEALCSL